MKDAFFFLSIAGLGMSVAGLAGLVSAFRRGEDAWDRVELWRLRAIARLSFTCWSYARSSRRYDPRKRPLLSRLWKAHWRNSRPGGWALKPLVEWCPRQDLNLCTRLRRPVLYPG